MIARTCILSVGIHFVATLLLLVLWNGTCIGQHTANRPREVPVLCYHQVRNYTASDGASAKAYTVLPERFEAQMKMLYDSGYKTILPNDLYAYYKTGKPLPPKPILITFDDNTASQYNTALPILNRYGFKAVFFVMTVSMDKGIYMTKEQLKTLHRQGHAIGSHTWNHKNVRQYTEADWKVQFDGSFKTLSLITGEPVHYFAYPYGSWSQRAVDELEKRGVKMAFILNTPKDVQRPLFTQRRLMVVGPWSAATLARQMRIAFPSH